jgi:hypothetical protein
MGVMNLNSFMNIAFVVEVAPSSLFTSAVLCNYFNITMTNSEILRLRVYGAGESNCKGYLLEGIPVCG